MGEACSALKQLGVKKGPRFLYRLARKAALSSAHCIEVYINARGDWNEQANLISNPIAQIIALHAATIRFKVAKLS